MTVTEKVAYLKGLAEGLKLDEDSDETKLFKAMFDVLDDLALTVSDLEDNLELVGEQVDSVDEDLDYLESYVYDDEDDDYDDDDDEYDDELDSDLYEVECPACGEKIYLDESIISDGSIDCPSCGESLEFDIDDCDDEECDCCDKEDK